MLSKSNKAQPVFSDAERAAMRERALELKAEKNRDLGEKTLLDKIAEMPAADKKIAEQIHKIVTTHAPNLLPKTWYGMPAYANKDGKIVCFFQAAAKFNARYSTFGFNDAAMLDSGNMWPTAFAVKKITATEEEQIIALVKMAVGN